MIVPAWKSSSVPETFNLYLKLFYSVELKHVMMYAMQNYFSKSSILMKNREKRFIICVQNFSKRHNTCYETLMIKW